MRYSYKLKNNTNIRLEVSKFIIHGQEEILFLFSFSEFSVSQQSTQLLLLTIKVIITSR